MAAVQYASSEFDDFYNMPRRRSSEPSLIDARYNLHAGSKEMPKQYVARVSPPSSVSTSPPPTDSSYASSTSETSADSQFDSCIDETLDEALYFPTYNNHYIADSSQLLTPIHIENITDQNIGDLDEQDEQPNPPSRPRSEPDSELNTSDDIVLRDEPTRHVDYLSHEWREEDIWASWKYMIGKRKVYSNAARLENASWRTWMKAKNNLKTVSPEKLNWLKDCDVTWLYGPLANGPNLDVLGTPPASPSEARIADTPSFLHHPKKTILKKRSMSEVLLQRSLSTSSLLKQATASIQAQQAQQQSHPERPVLPGRTLSDFAAYGQKSSTAITFENSSTLPSTMTSGIQSPISARKHIHFNNRVEQCIAVDAKEDEDEHTSTDVSSSLAADEDDDSDEGGLFLTMKPKTKPTTVRTSTRASFSDTQTIARLPATTLKAGVEIGDLKPSTSSSNLASFLLGPSPSGTAGGSSLITNNEEDDDELDIGWKPSGAFASRRDSIAVNQARYGDFGFDDDLGGYNECPPTPPSGNDSIFGRAVDAVNTARDIAHIFWNVGWASRK